jgi:two-component system, OmpR family, response regulator
MKAGANILVIDDNTEMRELLKEYLETKGYTVFDAADGQEALDLMSKAVLHLAIVDLDMPRMNGLEFTKKAKEQNPHFPIIMVTAYSQFYSPGEIFASGVDAFLQKPIDLARLTKAIEQL